jgi:hypothetical protein
MKKYPYITLASLYAITGLLLLVIATESCASKSCRSYRSKPDTLRRIR